PFTVKFDGCHVNVSLFTCTKMFLASSRLPSVSAVSLSKIHLLPSRSTVPAPNPPSASKIHVRRSPVFGSVPIICIPVTVLSFSFTVNVALMNVLLPNLSYLVSTAASPCLAVQVPINQSRSFRSSCSSASSRMEASSHLPSSRTHKKLNFLLEEAPLSAV